MSDDSSTPRDPEGLVAHSEDVDNRLDALLEEHDKPTRRLFGIVVLLVVVAFTVQFAVLGWLTLENRRVVVTQIPALDRVHELEDERDRLELQLEDATFILNEQAVPAIVQMQNQIRELGGTPPRVILRAPKRPPAELQP